MANPIDQAVVALPLETVHALTVSGTVEGGERVHTLRSAGHAGGEALADAFERYVATKYGTQAADLEVDAFGARLEDFFERAGWGSVHFHALHDAVAAVDVGHAWEARARPPSAAPGCHITTGAMSAFFGRFAGYPVAALEVECAVAGQDHCRFLLGPPDVLEIIYRGLLSGQSYEHTLGQLSAADASA